MRRWNGWGDDQVDYPIPEKALDFLEKLVGKGKKQHPIELKDVVKNVQSSKLKHAHGIVLEADERIKHSYGQSIPDWIEMRIGPVRQITDGVAYPESPEDLVYLIEHAKHNKINLIPYGGGTSVLGHITPLGEKRQNLTVDLQRMRDCIELDEESLLATFETGITGPDIEAQLRARGYTLGHYPQSFEYSTLGGWIATRSSGQQSKYYGRIDDLFFGGKLLSPGGETTIYPFPASAAGPSVKEQILGSEGRLGFITQATVKISPLPEKEEFHAVFFPNWEAGYRAVQEISQQNLQVSMLRYSDPVETETTLILAGHEILIGTLEKLISLRGVKEGKTMLLIGYTGTQADVNFTRNRSLEICRDSDGVHVGRRFGSQWHKSRFRTPYLRNTLWEYGYAIDTLETAVPWSEVNRAKNGIESAIRQAANEFNEPVHIFTHLSHLYPTGSSIYTTYLFRIKDDSDAALEFWRRMKTAASRTIVEHRGTISHQHGVGIDHKQYLESEKSTLGLRGIKEFIHEFDPQRIMNPGKLLD